MNLQSGSSGQGNVQKYETIKPTPATLLNLPTTPSSVGSSSRKTIVAPPPDELIIPSASNERKPVPNQTQPLNGTSPAPLVVPNPPTPQQPSKMAPPTQSEPLRPASSNLFMGHPREVTALRTNHEQIVSYQNKFYERSGRLVTTLPPNLTVLQPHQTILFPNPVVTELQAKARHKKIKDNYFGEDPPLPRKRRLVELFCAQTEMATTPLYVEVPFSNDLDVIRRLMSFHLLVPPDSNPPSLSSQPIDSQHPLVLKFGEMRSNFSSTVRRLSEDSLPHIHTLYIRRQMDPNRPSSPLQKQSNLNSFQSNSNLNSFQSNPSISNQPTFSNSFQSNSNLNSYQKNLSISNQPTFSNSNLNQKNQNSHYSYQTTHQSSHASNAILPPFPLNVQNPTRSTNSTTAEILLAPTFAKSSTQPPTPVRSLAQKSTPAPFQFHRGSTEK